MDKEGKRLVFELVPRGPHPLTMKNCWPKKFIEFAKKRDKTRLVFVDESGIDRCLH